MRTCNCKTFYLLDEKPMCLHRLFQHSLVGAVARSQSWRGIRFFLYRYNHQESSKEYKRGWWENGPRVEVTNVGEILVAVSLAHEYNVRRIKI